jgi:outer membrane receptor protein involved in Fe transport
MQWDFTGRYQITDRWQIYMEVVNINDEPEHYYSGNSSRLLQFDEIGRMATLGVQFNLQ